MTETWGQFIRGNVGLFILSTMVLVMLGFMLHVSHDHADTNMLSWSREQGSLVLGALLGMITGRTSKESPLKPAGSTTLEASDGKVILTKMPADAPPVEPKP